MSKVYVLIEGYETVVGVFSEASKEIAESYLENNSNMEIQEFVLDTIQKPFPSGYRGYRVYMNSDFVVNEKYTRAAGIHEVIAYENEHPGDNIEISGYTGDYIVTCFARDIDHAVQIASGRIIEVERKKEAAESA